MPTHILRVFSLQKTLFFKAEKIQNCLNFRTDKPIYKFFTQKYWPVLIHCKKLDFFTKITFLPEMYVIFAPAVTYQDVIYVL
jgi:hypothetical protein